jgi:hypothetical protein
MPKGDIYFFNPFAEGFGKKSPAVQLYYKAVRVAFNLNLSRAVLYMANQVLASKTAIAEKTDYPLPSAVLRMTSVPIDRKTSFYDIVDDKLIGEFEKLFERIDNECIFTPYLQQQMTTKVKCDALTDDKWDEKFGKDIRKKSLLAFKAALMGVLGITTPEELSTFQVKYDPELKTSAKFYTTMAMYLKLYSRFNDVLADAWAVEGKLSERDEINLGELAAAIERFPLAYAIAKHMVQPILPKSHPTDIQPVDTSRLRIGDGTGSRRFPGPEIIDEFGRRSRQPALQIGMPVDANRRFKPHVISDAPSDPFAPATRAVGGGGAFGGTGLGFGAASTGGYFSGSSGGFGQGGGLNMSAPSNFNTPETRRNYF